MCRSVSRKSLLTGTDPLLNSSYFPLPNQISGSKQMNSVMISAAAVRGCAIDSKIVQRSRNNILLKYCREALGLGFGRTDFCGFVFADFVARLIVLVFWKKCPEKSSSKKSRQNPPKFTQQKSPTHFCRGAGPRS